MQSTDDEKQPSFNSDGPVDEYSGPFFSAILQYMKKVEDSKNFSASSLDKKSDQLVGIISRDSLAEGSLNTPEKMEELLINLVKIMWKHRRDLLEYHSSFSKEKELRERNENIKNSKTWQQKSPKSLNKEGDLSLHFSALLSHLLNQLYENPKLITQLAKTQFGLSFLKEFQRFVMVKQTPLLPSFPSDQQADEDYIESLSIHLSKKQVDDLVNKSPNIQLVSWLAGSNKNIIDGAVENIRNNWRFTNWKIDASSVHSCYIYQKLFYRTIKTKTSELDQIQQFYKSLIDFLNSLPESSTEDVDQDLSQNPQFGELVDWLEKLTTDSTKSTDPMNFLWKFYEEFKGLNLQSKTRDISKSCIKEKEKLAELFLRFFIPENFFNFMIFISAEQRIHIREWNNDNALIQNVRTTLGNITMFQIPTQVQKSKDFTTPTYVSSLEKLFEYLRDNLTEKSQAEVNDMITRLYVKIREEVQNRFQEEVEEDTRSLRFAIEKYIGRKLYACFDVYGQEGKEKKFESICQSLQKVPLQGLYPGFYGEDKEVQEEIRQLSKETGSAKTSFEKFFCLRNLFQYLAELKYTKQEEIDNLLAYTIINAAPDRVDLDIRMIGFMTTKPDYSLNSLTEAKLIIQNLHQKWENETKA